MEAMDEELRNDPAITPTEEDMENCEVCTQADEKTTKLYNDLWKELKAD